MSRVLSDTSLRRGAALALVALATTFAACGDDGTSEPQASSPAPAATSAPSEPGSGQAQADDAKADDAGKDEPKATEKASEKGSEKPASTSKPSEASASLDKQIRHVRSVLKTAGYKLDKAVPANSTTGAIRLDGASIFFFQTEDSAADAEKQAKSTYKAAGGKAAIGRDGTHVFIVRAEGGQSEAEAALKKLRQAAAAA